MTEKTKLLFISVGLHLKTERREPTFVPDFFIIILQQCFLSLDLILNTATINKHTTITQRKRWRFSSICFGIRKGTRYSTETVQVTPLRRTLASSP